MRNNVPKFPKFNNSAWSVVSQCPGHLTDCDYLTPRQKRSSAKTAPPSSRTTRWGRSRRRAWDRLDLCCLQNPGPMVEIRFWEAKCMNLESLFDQMKDDITRKMASILNVTDSAYYPCFRYTTGRPPSSRKLE